jgi:hypothetical protein
MAVIRGPRAYQYSRLGIEEPVDSTVNLSTTQTFAGSADSTNTADRGQLISGAMLKIVSAIGATPTVTVNLQGSIDGSVFFNVPYSLTATPTTFVITAITITTATTNNYILQSAQPWRYFKLVMSANTNVTLTSDVYFRGV